MDGLIVGLDMLCRFVGTKKYRKRVFLITDGEKETAYSKGELGEIVETIKKNDIKLNAITLDFCNELAEDEDEDEDEERAEPAVKEKQSDETEPQQKNKEFLMQLQEQTGCAVIPVATAIELYQQFKKKEIASRSKFRGNLDISPELKLAIQIFAKTRQETLPSLKKYSKLPEECDKENAGKVSIEKTYTEIDDPDQKPIHESGHTKAFYYGKQLVPVSDENANVLKLQQ